MFWASFHLEARSLYVSQAGLELKILLTHHLSVRMTVVHHYAQLLGLLLEFLGVCLNLRSTLGAGNTARLVKYLSPKNKKEYNSQNLCKK